MIELVDVHKTYHTRHGSATVLEGVQLLVKPGEKVGILGRNGAGKSTLIRIIGGIEMPTRGKIRRSMSVSWPLAFSGAFQGSLTGLDNFRFICRVHGVNAEEKLPYVQDFSELGKYLYEPIRTYSAGMRARLAFAASMAVDFDCFLIDEVMAVGDARFQEKCEIELFQKRKDRAMIIVSHFAASILPHCSSAYVLDKGRMLHFEDPNSAYQHYTALQS